MTELEAQLAAANLKIAASDQLLQRTTLDEFLRHQYELIFKRFEVQSNLALATKDSITGVRGRLYPSRLKPWTQFPADRQALFRDIHQTWNPPAGPIRDLPSLDVLQEEEQTPERIVSSEADLKQFHAEVVERNVEPHSLQDGDPELEARRQEPVQDSSKAKAPTQYQNAPRYADQFCITYKDNAARLIFIEEFKAPHKLTLPFLDAILGDLQLDDELDVLAVRDFDMGCADPDGRLYLDAEKLVASAKI
ncbi:MAG: hypothetical protein L6R36_007000 [Xanthoria steineri]|nr:MAG: hypothetical protein L6R36_007000 [Xanthoria steineri]